MRSTVRCPCHMCGAVFILTQTGEAVPCLTWCLATRSTACSASRISEGRGEPECNLTKKNKKNNNVRLLQSLGTQKMRTFRGNVPRFSISVWKERTVLLVCVAVFRRGKPGPYMNDTTNKRWRQVRGVQPCGMCKRSTLQESYWLCVQCSRASMLLYLTVSTTHPSLRKDS